MTNTPENITITIITATFNRAHFIEESLDSILNQSFQDWECLIIDDGSSDNTPEILKKYTVADSRIKYFKRTVNYRKGLPGCRNQGLDMAKGEYVVFFDDDDIVHPENLKTCINLLQESRQSFCRYNKQPFTGNWSGESFQPVKHLVPCKFGLQDINKMITGKIPFASCCVIWKRECFEKNRFNEDLMYAEEWECYSRILAEGYEGISLEQVLYYNRKHSKSNTGEFRKNDPNRKNSKIKAAKLVIRNLTSNKLLKPVLEKFFVRMAFDLKSLSLMNLTLEEFSSGWFKKMKYKSGFLFYPVLRPLLKLKGKLK